MTEFWNHIIHTGLLGTGKAELQQAEAPERLRDALAALPQPADREESFLQAAALGFNYRRSGVLPLPGDGLQLQVAAAEEKPYCTPQAALVLEELLADDQVPLVSLWLERCIAAGCIVPPPFIPQLLTIAARYKNIQAQVRQVYGKRGEWLMNFHPDGLPGTTATSPEDQWQTGTPEERKAVLLQWRETDPAKAREALQLVWGQEDAATRQALLELLATGLRAEDLPFLESVATDKSKKVRDAALSLLQLIPSSKVVQQYWSVLGEAVQLKKEKALLGIVSRQVLRIQWPATVPEEVFRTGIEKVSSLKGMKDEDYIGYQLVSRVPPQFWEGHLGADPAAVLGYFRQHPLGKTLVPSIGLAASRFRDARWARLLTGDDKDFYPDLAPLLPLPERERYLFSFMDKHPEPVLELLTGGILPAWSPEVTEAVFRITAASPYQFNRHFYNRYIAFIDPGIAPKLEQFTPGQDYLAATWRMMTAHIRHLLSLKEKTVAAFQTKT